MMLILSVQREKYVYQTAHIVHHRTMSILTMHSIIVAICFLSFTVCYLCVALYRQKWPFDMYVTNPVLFHCYVLNKYQLSWQNLSQIPNRCTSDSQMKWLLFCVANAESTGCYWIKKKIYISWLYSTTLTVQEFCQELVQCVICASIS